MAQPQKGVCAEPNLHALYLMFNVVDDEPQNIKPLLNTLLDVFEFYDEEHFESMLSGLIAIGTSFWSELYPDNRPTALRPFPEIGDADIPILPNDLFVQIRSDRADVCHEVGSRVCEILSPHTELVEQVKGFRFLDGRDLSGFVINATNPKGLNKMAVAVVADEDPEFTGGSYIHVQRYQHQLARWNSVSEAEQEYSVGRGKDTNQPLPDALFAQHSHAARMQQAQQQGGILRQSMPYGDMMEQGLYFVSCARHPSHFENLLSAMLARDEEGEADPLFTFSTPQTGAAFFAPSVRFLRSR